MASLDATVARAIVAIVDYRQTTQPNKKQIHHYCRAVSLLELLLPSTRNKAYQEIDRRLQELDQQNYW